MDDIKLPPLPEPYSRQWINCPFTERLLFTDEQMHAYARAALAAAPAPDPDTADAEIGRQWREDSSLEKWFPLTAERLAALEADTAALKREAHTWWTAARDALAAAPAPAPLTDEQMRDALRQCTHDAMEALRVRWLYAKDFASAIERAHGIGTEARALAQKGE